MQEELDRLRSENEQLRDLLRLVQEAGAANQVRGVVHGSGAAIPALPTMATSMTQGQGVVRPPHLRYRVLRRVAAGGMAEIFLAEAESIQGFVKRVAIKRILPRLTQTQRFLDMFLDEARLSLRLQHSRIVQVFDIGRVDDVYFIVMEYVDGLDLRTLLNWRARLGVPMPVAVSLHIALEVCTALAYAHELAHPSTGAPLGVVHRDVTPANVLLSRQGEVKVLDFGVAKATSQTLSTDPGVIKGKLGYLAPETAHGRDIDHRVDLFAVGILLFEMLAARRLFRGDNEYETIQLVRAAQVPRLTEINEHVDDELDAIVRHILAANPDHRYQSAADAADALSHYAAARGLGVTPRTLARVVQRCIRDREDWTNRGLVPAEVDEALKEEVEKFASIIYDPDSSELARPGDHSGVTLPPLPPPPATPPSPPEDTAEISLSDAIPETAAPAAEEGTLLLERTPPGTAIPSPRPPWSSLAPLPAAGASQRLDPTLESINTLKREQRRSFWQVGVGLCVLCLITAGIIALA